MTGTMEIAGTLEVMRSNALAEKICGDKDDAVILAAEYVGALEFLKRSGVMREELTDILMKQFREEYLSA